MPQQKNQHTKEHHHVCDVPQTDWCEAMYGDTIYDIVGRECAIDFACDDMDVMTACYQLATQEMGLYFCATLDG
jgi:hypothetical protein